MNLPKHTAMCIHQHLLSEFMDQLQERFMDMHDRDLIEGPDYAHLDALIQRAAWSELRDWVGHHSWDYATPLDWQMLMRLGDSLFNYVAFENMARAEKSITPDGDKTKSNV